MNVITDIFAEYINMRSNGLGVNDTLKVLRHHIDSLPKSQKQELGNYVRSWEKKHSTSEKPKTQSRVKALNKEAVATKTDTVKAIKPLSSQASWVTCANCSRKNRVDEIFCFSCGHMLEHMQGKYNTRQFAEANNSIFPPHHFGADSVMVIKVRDKNMEYELRPQMSEHELVIGRVADNSVMTPDIDLSDCNGEMLGVSRLHLAFKYEPKDETIHMYDLGSANGSFVNGQKLHPKELRILRDGDELRLGRLVTRIVYFHPGEELH